MLSGNVRVAVEGCGHGTLKAIYTSIHKSCQVKGWDGVDLLMIGGDFQAVRNSTDLNCMAVPLKYREIGDFHEYYSGARVAPFLTVFVGGNHEASNYLFELYYGGWVAPNIYYLGAANVLRLGSLRIAGLSGIWKGYNYKKPHYERLPYNSDDVRSIYHVREVDTRKLLQLRSQVDVGLSHDWPRGVEWLGDFKWLFNKKDLFEADALAGNLGSVAAKLVLDRLRPPHWFSAHLHIKYAAVVEHKQNGEDQKNGTSATKDIAIAPASNCNPVLQNQDEIDLDMDDDEHDHPESVTFAAPVKNSDEIDLDDDIDAAPETVSADIAEAVDETVANKRRHATISEDLRAQLPAAFSKPLPPAPEGPEPEHTITNTRTNFLALDKCLPNRNFLQLLEIPTHGSASQSDDKTIQRPLSLSYDPEWLAITRAFAKYDPLVLGDPYADIQRDKGRAHYAPLIDDEIAWVQENVADKDLLTVPENFEITAPVYDDGQPVTTMETPKEYTSLQTARFCEMLGIENPFDANEEERATRIAKGPRETSDAGRGFGRGSRGRGGGRGRGRGFGGGRGGHGGFGGRARGRGRG